MPEAYTPLKHIRLVSDGEQFHEVPTRPSSPLYFDFSLDTEMSLNSAFPVAAASRLTDNLQSPATTTSSTAPAAVAANPSNPSSPFLPPSSPSPPPSALTDGQQPAMSQADARAVIKAYILAAAWFTAHEMEPRVDGEGVPECARLLASPEDSIWACFYRRVLRNDVTIFKCAEAGCPHQTPRLDRAEDHQRSKSRHKPFACTDSGWYEAGSAVVICLSC